MRSIIPEKNLILLGRHRPNTLNITLVVDLETQHCNTKKSCTGGGIDLFNLSSYFSPLFQICILMQLLTINSCVTSFRI